MNKLLLTTLCGLGLIAGSANAAHDMHDQHMKMDPVCHELRDHMQKSHPAIEAAIKANDAPKVGEMVIADHMYMEDFFAKHPQCKEQMHEMKKAMKAEMIKEEMPKAPMPAMPAPQ